MAAVEMQPTARHVILCALAAGLHCSTPRANPVSDQVSALTEDQRRAVFARLFQREGEQCSSVSRAFYQGRAKDGSAFWSVACAGGKDWQVMIRDTPSGDMSILDCAVLKAVGGGRCFKKF
jgi:hypothetical protein